MQGLCFVLDRGRLNEGFVVVTRFEPELIFITPFCGYFAGALGDLAARTPGYICFLLKPEFWLQGLINRRNSDLIRLLWLCIALALGHWRFMGYTLAAP